MSRRVDQYQQMRVFAAVAQEGNFARAAIALAIPASSVSKTIGQLEQRLGIALFRRTTRHMVLSEEGADYLRTVTRVLRDVQLVEDRLRTGDEMRGTLHVTAPVAFSEHMLSSKLPEFCMAYPELMIDFDTDRRYLDLVSNNIDVAIRTHVPGQDSPFFALELLPHVNFLVASPAYLERAGTPQAIDDLYEHKLLYFDWPRKQDVWQLKVGTDMVSIECDAIFRTNSYKTLNACALQGVGIANLPADYALEYIAAGKLVHVLPQLIEHRGNRVALYHRRRNDSTKTDAFLTFLQTTIAPHRERVLRYLEELRA